MCILTDNKTGVLCSPQSWAPVSLRSSKSSSASRSTSQLGILGSYSSGLDFLLRSTEKAFDLIPWLPHDPQLPWAETWQLVQQGDTSLDAPRVSPCSSSQGVKSAVVYGGTPMSTDKEMLKDWLVDPDECMNATSSPEFPHWQNMYALGQCPCSTKTRKSSDWLRIWSSFLFDQSTENCGCILRSFVQFWYLI